MSKFVAIDGEAIDGAYALLCASTGKAIYSAEELSTLECLQFLLLLAKKNQGKKFVCFGLNYDVNMMLKDLSREKLEELWRSGEAWITLDGFSFHLEWIPRKCFNVYSPDIRQRIRIYDVFGFFQSSFVKALEDWKIPDPNGDIKRMKAERSRFTRGQRKEIAAYCLSECKLLVTLMDALDESMLEAGIKLRSYMGAGSVAGALLQKEKVKRHHVSDSEQTDRIRAIFHHAYFGGRIEIFMQGLFNDLVNYDVRSAYPAEAMSLPSLVGGTWKDVTEWTGSPHAIYRVEWNIENASGVMPFPLRRKGLIFYPTNGRGWYHAREVKAALALFGESQIRILDGIQLEPATDDKPFAFIRDYYRMRYEAKAAGKASEKAYKLGLNSLYGKLAQGLSHKGEPPFRSLYWAGRITSGTRARLLDCASLNPSSVVSMATDGITFLSDPKIEESNELGGYERTEFETFFIAQPGIYIGKEAGGKEVRKSRGFFTREIDYEDLRRGWLDVGPTYTQRGVCECGIVHDGPISNCDGPRPRTRFVGIGSALMREDFGVWRTWADSERGLSLGSARKFYATEKPARAMRLIPPTFPTVIESEAYVPKTKTIEEMEAMRELIEFFDQQMTLF